MKKAFFIAALLFSAFAYAAPAPSEVNEKVLKAFQETFSTAKDVSWHEYDKMYQANFRIDEVQVRAQYDESGNLLKTIRYYGEAQLVPNIVAKLKKKYAGKEIFGVTETSADDEVSFVINLKDDTHWYIVKSDIYGHLELSDKFKRGDK